MGNTMTPHHRITPVGNGGGSREKPPSPPPLSPLKRGRGNGGVRGVVSAGGEILTLAHHFRKLSPGHRGPAVHGEGRQ